MIVNLHLGASYIGRLLTTCNAFVTILESCDLNIHRISLILSAAAAAADDALPPEAEVDGRVEAPPVLLLQEIHVT